jgi:hypothetical protein
VTTRVVGAIAPELEHAEIERASRKPTGDLQAYDYYLRGMACLYRQSSEPPTRLSRSSTRLPNSTLQSPCPSLRHRSATCSVRRMVGPWTETRTWPKPRNWPAVRWN